MATAIQIAVAGGLLLAWIVVLTRSGRDRANRSNDHAPRGRAMATAAQGRGTPPHPGDVSSESDPTSEELARTARAMGIDDDADRREQLVAWLRRPVPVWRRQLMLAMVFATFASLLLLIALRGALGGTFIWLFLLMAGLLVSHVTVAAIIGRRLNDASRAVVVAKQKKKVPPAAGGMSIRANLASQVSLGTTVGPILEGDETPLAPPKGSEDEKPFDPAAEVAALLEESGIEEPEASEAEAGASPAGGNAAEGTGEHTDDAAAPVPKKGRGSKRERRGRKRRKADGESVFRRAAKDEPARPRRKAKPIYIESQLDEDDDDGLKAVNHP